MKRLPIATFLIALSIVVAGCGSGGSSPSIGSESPAPKVGAENSAPGKAISPKTEKKRDSQKVAPSRVD